MANVFKGMAKDKFLDDLATKTGKNGHELYDYLMELLAEKEEEEEELKEAPVVYERSSFVGTREEFYGFLELIGVPRYTKKGNDIFGACTGDALANAAANTLGVDIFVWNCIVKTKACKTITIDYYGIREEKKKF